MSIRVSLRTLKNTVAIASVIAAATTLAGCSTFGMGASSDQVVTGSTGYSGSGNLNQPMPSALGATTRVAEGPYIPPEDIGGGPGYPNNTGMASAPVTASISSQDLPVLPSSSNGNAQAMSAQHNLAPVPVGLKTASLGNPAAITPNLSVVPQGTYTHVIQSGESLYTIARHYNVTAQAIVQASGLSSPDKIFVGQRVVIPGRPDLLAAMDNSSPSPVDARLPADSSVPQLAATHEPAPIPMPTRVASLGNEGLAPTPLAEAIAPIPHSLKPKLPLAQAPAPAVQPAVVQTASIAPQPAKLPIQEPAVSGADKFRWPVTGKVIVDFAASKGTGINIAAPAGTPVRAAENGTVIYVGSGVEGYGNLVLIRHANGYVSAYANLKDIGVTKGAAVNRGDAIGTAGMTGSVTSPQLHFELRKGATPVDPVPLLG